MSERDFDPYHQWLGVPPKDQPADYYRLLGVDRFEPNPDVISSAADRQMSHVRGFQSGPRAALAEKMLNKLSAARVCLLDAQKKASYDAKLTQHLAKKATKQPLQEAEPLQVKPVAPTQTAPVQPKKAGNSWLPVVAVGCAAVVIVVVAFTLLRNGENDDDPTTVAQRDTPADVDLTLPKPAEFDPPDNKPEPSPVSGKELFEEKIEVPVTPPTKSDDSDPEPTPPSPSETDKPVPGPDSETPVGPGPLSESGSGSTSTAPPETEAPSSGNPIQPETKLDEPVDSTKAEPAEEPDEPKRLPVPDAAVQQKTLEQLKGVYQAEFDAAKTPEAQVKLAELLLEQVDKLSGSPKAVYVVLQQARNQAVEAGALDIAEDAIGQMAETFEVDTVALQVELMIDISKKAQSTDQRKDFANAALAVVDSALAEDRYDEAEQLAKLAGSLAARARDLELRKKVQVARQEVTRLANLGAAVSRARKTLSTDKDDPKANLTVGLHLCLAKGKWKEGLVHLAKGSDAGLKSTATTDIASPEDPKAQLALANAWYDLAKGDKDYTGFYARAGLWYEQAVEKLEGLQRTGAERRVAEIAKMDLGSPDDDGAVANPRRVGVVRGTATGAKPLGRIDVDARLVKFSPDGRTVAVKVPGGAFLYDVQTGKKIVRIDRKGGYRDIWSLAFSLDGLSVALGNQNLPAAMWDLRTGKEIFSFGNSTGKHYGVTISPDGKIITSGIKGTIHLFDAKDGKPLASLVAQLVYIWCIAFTPDSKAVAAVDTAGQCIIWDLKSRQVIGSFNRGVRLQSVDFSPDGKLLAVGGGIIDKSADLAIYDSSGRDHKKLEGHTDIVMSVVFSPDGKTLASAGGDKTVRLWDPATGKETVKLQAAGNSCDISPDGKILVTCGNRSLQFWELEFGKRKRAK